MKTLRQKTLRTTARRSACAGFTLAEVAVTVLIVGLGLTMILQGLNACKIRAAYTRSAKQARELALVTLGEIESGLFWEEVDEGIDHLGPQVFEDFPDYTYEILFGDEDQFYDYDADPDAPFDNWAWSEYQRRESEDYDEDEEEQEAQPYEKIRVKVTFPKFGDRENEIVFERWVPWAQVYGEEEVPVEDEAATGEAGSEDPGAAAPAGGRGGGNG